ncbi:DUF5335 family protein [Fodinibius sp. AD559]|uniref:DUF5335 family protein n=1 Tax=Fodinibius sp. AD559 TaxID=3424179 RepID=UPI004046989E
MPIREIEKEEWQNYFDAFSKKYLKDEEPEYVEITVLDDSAGAQLESHWMPLRGITFDDKNDLLEIELDKLKRLIRHPEKIYVDEADNGWLLSLEVVQRDGTKDIIETR